MSLKAHKVIDALLDRGRLDIDVARGCTVAYRRDLAQRIAVAPKFDFGIVPSICIGTEDVSDSVMPEWRDRVLTLAPVFRLPELTVNEIAWWADGYFPLPFPSVWYEFYLGDAMPTMKVCTLINWREGGWDVEVLNVHKASVSVTGAILRILLDAATFDLKSPDHWVNFQISGNDLPLCKAAADRITNSWAGKLRLAVWLTIALNSKSTDKRTELAPPRLNKQRAARGQTPLFDYTVVDIMPSRYLDRASLGGTHASPRAHKPRSHIRHLSHQVPNGRLIESGEHAGQWAIVIPWCWVNKTEVDALTQEYLVRLPRSPDQVQDYGLSYGAGKRDLVAPMGVLQ
jgi:hypothetical protein